MSLRLTGFRDGNHNASPTDELLQGGAQLDDLVIPDNHTRFLADHQESVFFVFRIRPEQA
jgi:hypothetical protein